MKLHLAPKPYDVTPYQARQHALKMILACLEVEDYSALHMAPPIIKRRIGWDVRISTHKRGDEIQFFDVYARVNPKIDGVTKPEYHTMRISNTSGSTRPFQAFVYSLSNHTLWGKESSDPSPYVGTLAREIERNVEQATLTRSEFKDYLSRYANELRYFAEQLDNAANDL